MNALLALCAFVLTGFVLRLSGALPEGAVTVLNRFILYVSVPALVLLRVPAIPFSRKLLVPALTPWVALAVSALLVLAFARLASLSRSTTGALLMVVPLGNTSFLGYPMVEALLGKAALPYAVLYDQFGSFVALTTYGALVLARYGSGAAPSVASAVRRVFTFPPFLAFLLALATRGRVYPAPVVTLLEALAVTLLPLSMIAVGSQLRLRLDPADRLPVAFGLAVKMVVAPAVVFAVCRAAGAYGDGARASILEAAMPPMVTAGVLAATAGLAPRLAAAALVGVGLLLSFVTLPLLARIL